MRTVDDELLLPKAVIGFGRVMLSEAKHLEVALIFWLAQMLRFTQHDTSELAGFDGESSLSARSAHISRFADKSGPTGVHDHTDSIN